MIELNELKRAMELYRGVCDAHLSEPALSAFTCMMVDLAAHVRGESSLEFLAEMAPVISHVNEVMGLEGIVIPPAEAES